MRSILLVDGEPENREFLKQEFEAQNYTVLEADDARQAIEILSAHSVDAVVLDLELSQRQRKSLMKEILSSKCGSPLVFIMASPNELSREEAYELGAAGAMSKPVNPSYLLSRIGALLTPADSRWMLTPSSNRAQHKVAASVSKGQLGRGGFALSTLQDKELLEGETVEFKVEVNHENDRWTLNGTGVVRYVNHDTKSRRQRAWGIEFESLDDASRKRVLDANFSAQDIPYIPRLAN
jgi:DNA-binding response OmpR family regulator